MSIEVKQLTINSVFQRDENKSASSERERGTDTDVAEESAEKTGKKQPGEASSLDPDMIKADVLAACKKLIRESLNERRVR
ncbi:MAG: hypothetical protein P8X74_10265 [Reinekea sp.]